MRRGYGTTARRPSTRYSVHLVLERKYVTYQISSKILLIADSIIILMSDLPGGLD